MDKKKLLIEQTKVIGEIMHKHDWTRKEIAKEIGVSVGSIGHWINGTYVASPENMKALELLLKNLCNKNRMIKEISKTKQKSYSITASVTKEEWVEIHDKAKQKGVTVSELVYKRVFGKKTFVEKVKSLFQ